MLRIILLPIFTICLCSCKSIHPISSTAVGASFQGVFNTETSVAHRKIILIHGIGCRAPGYSLHLQEKIAFSEGYQNLHGKFFQGNKSGNTIYINLPNEINAQSKINSAANWPTLIEELSSNLKQQCESNDEGQNSVLPQGVLVTRFGKFENGTLAESVSFYEVNWSMRIQKRKKDFLDYEAIQQEQRSLINNLIKQRLLNETLSDVIAYLGNERVAVVEDVAQSLCLMFADDWLSNGEGLETLLSNQEAARCSFDEALTKKTPQKEDFQYSAITYSLGSRILLDTLYSDSVIDYAPDVVDKLDKGFLLANQIPLLELWSAEHDNSFIENENRQVLGERFTDWIAASQKDSSLLNTKKFKSVLNEDVSYQQSELYSTISNASKKSVLSHHQEKLDDAKNSIEEYKRRLGHASDELKSRQEDIKSKANTLDKLEEDQRESVKKLTVQKLEVDKQNKLIIGKKEKQQELLDTAQEELNKQTSQLSSSIEVLIKEVQSWNEVFSNRLFSKIEENGGWLNLFSSKDDDPNIEEDSINLSKDIRLSWTACIDKASDEFRNIDAMIAQHSLRDHSKKSVERLITVNDELLDNLYKAKNSFKSIKGQETDYSVVFASSCNGLAIDTVRQHLTRLNNNLIAYTKSNIKLDQQISTISKKLEDLVSSKNELVDKINTTKSTINSIDRKIDKITKEINTLKTEKEDYARSEQEAKEGIFRASTDIEKQQVAIDQIKSIKVSSGGVYAAHKMLFGTRELFEYEQCLALKNLQSSLTQYAMSQKQIVFIHSYTSDKNCKKPKEVFLDLVALNDPDDILSYQVAENIYPQETIRIKNVSVSLGRGIPSLFINPVGAHENFNRSNEVIAFLTCGGEVKPIRRETGHFIDKRKGALNTAKRERHNWIPKEC